MKIKITINFGIDDDLKLIDGTETISWSEIPCFWSVSIVFTSIVVFGPELKNKDY